MNEINKLIELLDLDELRITLDGLNNFIHSTNVKNEWRFDLFISLDSINDRLWYVNFWGMRENMVFERVGDSNYFKRCTSL